MITIEFQFLNRRWHATPWDHHVNEGVVEWPPSPWRLSRALLATWHQRAADIAPEAVQALLSAFAQAEFSYVLPDVELGHTRHYMPIANNKTTKVIDAFFTPADSLCVNIGAELAPDARETLARLLAQMTYFGRAESWIEARLVDDALVPNCGAGVGEGEVVRVLCPMTDQEYSMWRNGMLDGMRLQKLHDVAKKKGKAIDEIKLSKADLQKIEQVVPATVFDAMHLDTADIQKGGWNLPPGAKWVVMRRPAVVAASTPPRISWTRELKPPTVLRFAVDSNVQPRMTDVLHVADTLHTQLSAMSKRHGLEQQLRTQLTGKVSSDAYVQGHEHLFILPEPAADDPRRVGTIALYLAGGFQRELIDFFAHLHKLWGTDDFREQDLVFLDFEDTEAGGSGACATGRVWESVTPFIATRHTKRGKFEDGYEVGSREHDLVRLLVANGFDRPTRIELLDEDTGRWAKFRTHRSQRGKRSNGKRGPHRAMGYRLTFDTPQVGPMAVGFGAHFGLGMFVAVE